MQREFLDHHSLSQQGEQPHVGYQFVDVGDGVSHLWQRVVLLDHAEVVDTQVEGPLQADVPYGDVHACLLRGDGRHLLRHPVLNGRQVE